MARLPFTINGVDFSTYVSKRGVTVAYTDVKGGNAGYMLDGSYTDDVLARKAVITAVCNDLTDERLAALLTACANTYVTLTYYDTKLAAQRTASFMPQTSAHKVAIITKTGVKWWTALTLTMTER